MAIAQVTLIRSEIQKYVDDVLVEAMGKAIAEVVGEAEARLAAKIAALETKIAAFKFVGAWSELKTYKNGNFVSMGGQIYHCDRDTDSRPGTDGSWTLAVKSGRDGRDGRDAPEPEPRTVHTGRRSTPLPAVSAVRDNR